MSKKIPSSLITPEELYVTRRRFIKRSLISAASAFYLASCSPRADQAQISEEVLSDVSVKMLQDEQGNPLTSIENIYGYTNFYEFSLSKTESTDLARSLKTSPWTIEVGGLVNNPQVIDVDKIKSQFNIGERFPPSKEVPATFDLEPDDLRAPPGLCQRPVPGTRIEDDMGRVVRRD